MPCTATASSESTTAGFTAKSRTPSATPTTPAPKLWLTNRCGRVGSSNAQPWGAGERTYRLRIEWRPEAARNRPAQIEWITEQDPWAAIDVGDAIHEAIARLADHPATGRPGRAVSTRELVVVDTTYVVVYWIEQTSVLVLRILQGAKRWPLR